MSDRPAPVASRKDGDRAVPRPTTPHACAPVRSPARACRGRAGRAWLSAGALAALLAAACAPPPERAAPVGRAHAGFVDPSRPAWRGEGARPLATTLWYPAAPGTRETAWRIGVFQAGHGAPGAGAADLAGPAPLIVLSHGTGGSAAQLSWLAEALAAEGFLVAAPNHHGNTAAEKALMPQGFMLWWERAQDVSAVIDALLADPFWGPRIDASRIGAAGFSLGGHTVLSTAGALTDRAAWRAGCEADASDPACRPPPESDFSIQDLLELEPTPAVAASLARANASYRDVRIRAVYAMAPALTTAFDAGRLAEIGVPVRIVAGSLDAQVPAQTQLGPLAARIPDAQLHLFDGAGHYAFLAPCGLRGRALLAALCRDPAGIDRRVLHGEVGRDALGFFRAHLGAPAPASTATGPRDPP